MRFTVDGHSVEITHEEVSRRLNGVVPEKIQTHGARVNGTVYPVKQAVAVATGIARADFTSHAARRLLTRLGFELIGNVTTRASEPLATSTDSDPHGWPWEGVVQQVFADWLRSNGWTVLGMADTSTKAHGVDVLARKDSRLLGAEVKGWPSTGYADPRRAGELKRTQPTTQAGHWFSQALMKAIMLLDSHPEHESLVVLPDYPRYRDLARRTARGRTAAGIHVVFVRDNGTGSSDDWLP